MVSSWVKMASSLIHLFQTDVKRKVRRNGIPPEVAGGTSHILHTEMHLDPLNTLKRIKISTLFKVLFVKSSKDAGLAMTSCGIFTH